MVYCLLVPRRLHLCRDAAFLPSMHLSCTRLEAEQGSDQKTAVPALAQSAAEILQQKSKWCWFAPVWQVSRGGAVSPWPSVLAIAFLLSFTNSGAPFSKYCHYSMTKCISLLGVPFQISVGQTVCTHWHETSSTGMKSFIKVTRGFGY